MPAHAPAPAPAPTFPRAEWPADSAWSPLSAAARAASRRVASDLEVPDATFALAVYDKVSEFATYLRAMRDAAPPLEHWRLETDALCAAVYALADAAVPCAPELPDMLPFLRAALDAGYVQGRDGDEAMPAGEGAALRAFADEYGLVSEASVAEKEMAAAASLSADEGDASLARRRRRPKLSFRRRISLAPVPMGKIKIKSAALSHQFVRLAVSTP
ncbi:hypothetical protein Q8F55_005949 [Vanrija albida]|uniref:Uncharacterized protein n=1 Tax=Vanrija albida TaxID=181172 RepID=A0ABR3Q3D5_9TREE